MFHVPVCVSEFPKHISWRFTTIFSIFQGLVTGQWNWKVWTYPPKEKEENDFKWERNTHCCFVCGSYTSIECITWKLEYGSVAFLSLDLGSRSLILGREMREVHKESHPIRKWQMLWRSIDRGVGLWEEENIPSMWDRNKEDIVMKGKTKGIILAN